MRRVRAFGPGEHGAAMVEFAIVLPLLMLFAFGIIDMGRALKQYNNLAGAARDGARYGAWQKPPVPAAIITRVNNAFRATAGSTMPATNPTITISAQQVTVTIANYPYVPLTAVLPSVQGLAFTVSATFRREDVP